MMLFQAEDSDPVVTRPNTNASLVRAANTHQALSKQLIFLRANISPGVIFGIDSPALVQILDS